MTRIEKQEKLVLRSMLEAPNAIIYTTGDRLMVRADGSNASDYPIDVLASLQRKGFVLVIRDRIGISAAGAEYVKASA